MDNTVFSFLEDDVGQYFSKDPFSIRNSYADISQATEEFLLGDFATGNSLEGGPLPSHLSFEGSIETDVRVGKILKIPVKFHFGEDNVTIHKLETYMEDQNVCTTFRAQKPPTNGACSNQLYNEPNDTNSLLESKFTVYIQLLFSDGTPVSSVAVDTKPHEDTQGQKCKVDDGKLLEIPKQKATFVQQGNVVNFQLKVKTQCYNYGKGNFKLRFGIQNLEPIISPIDTPEINVNNKTSTKRKKTTSDELVASPAKKIVCKQPSQWTSATCIITPQDDTKPFHATTNCKQMTLFTLNDSPFCVSPERPIILEAPVVIRTYNFKASVEDMQLLVDKFRPHLETTVGFKSYIVQLSPSQLVTFTMYDRIQNAEISSKLAWEYTHNRITNPFNKDFVQLGLMQLISTFAFGSNIHQVM